MPIPKFCKAWVVVNGFAEISSIATSDLLLLLRIHVLWGNRREIVIGTLALYILSYASVAASGLAAAIEVVPHLRFDPLARQCFTDHKPKVLPVQWAATLALELFVLFMTAVKVLEHRRSDQILTPLMKALFYDQLAYYIIIARELDLAKPNSPSGLRNKA
ncbi:hypothetical protein M407DRAFT_22770 [Tulasnella calospora MUT 4182]|uniref:Uncharacterized protein n=1 Tax=Tulasnella calospora MUT 4182 TaxID=1051891 RepID=A0A0C3L2N3_9AGAM|nr:hypothetical protein M407DRAFT_22770 [Tulasnella calospora MUT 4182]